MGRRGPAPTPTALKVLRGETRPSRLNRDEPVPVGELVAVPDDLADDARAVWRQVMRDFGHTGVIRGVDSEVFRIYCEAVVRYRQASDLLRGSGPLVRGARQGELVKNPLHQIVRDNAALVRALAGELGLTPAARVGLRDANTRVSSAATVLAKLQARHAGRVARARGGPSRWPGRRPRPPRR